MMLSLYYPRRWSPQDEIAILREIIDFKNKIGKYPSEDRLRFYESAKNVVNFETNLRQFLEKVRHLEKRYRKKAKEGVEPSFENEHVRECFKWSKVIWGAEELAEKGHEDDGHGGDVESPPGCVTQTNWFKESNLLRSMEGFGVDSVLQKWSVLPTETKSRMEERSKSLDAKDVEIKKMEDMLSGRKRELKEIEEKLSAKQREQMLEKKALFDEVFSLITSAN
ncbi:unnamed protein product [Microthlaspi erraticum]|uniref:Uncharacterized protein n=1 Tax=Microthlaspi erraticum TaxID=1685480 RepID=A0A6D2IW91_9BRAS|nr:unnamed protein product [Microthlaspi erraticum]